MCKKQSEFFLFFNQLLWFWLIFFIFLGFKDEENQLKQMCNILKLKKHQE